MEERNNLEAASRSELRNQLIDKIQRGRLEPEEAEEEARRLGLAPLCPKPDPDAFDPMRIPDWTLPMALAWIMFRDAERVRSVWDEYQRKSYYWRSHRFLAERGELREGFYLQAGDPAGLNDLQVMEAYARMDGSFKYGGMDDTLKVSLAEARAELLQHLRTGGTSVTAIPENPHEKQERVQIPPIPLKDLDLYPSKGRIVLRSSTTGGVDLGFKHVLLDRADVTRHWSAAEARRAATSDKVAQCREWLIQLRKAGPPEKTKSEYKVEAMPKFDIGPHQFRTAWGVAAQAVPRKEWDKPGPRKKKSSG